MRYLLDTHSFLWFVKGDASLSVTSRNLIADPNIEIYLSTASIWEMAIKVSIRKLIVPSPLQQFLDAEIERLGLALLGITTEHADKVAGLPFYASRHRDPFDRLIIAQSLVENMPVISSDVSFDDYAISRVW